jgi:predicted dehydrogenase
MKPKASAAPERSHALSRREFVKSTATAAAMSATVGFTLPRVHAAENNTIQLALIGCGGRGSGAAANAFESPNGPVKLVAMADLLPNRLQSSLKALNRLYADKIDVPADRQFIGFDAYKKAIDCLRPGDVAMLTGYAAFRPHQLEYAVEKGVNVFMEKSFAVDPPGVRRLIKAGAAAEKQNLKIAAGLMCRHSRNRQELIRRLRDGQLGQIQLIRAYRMCNVGALRRKPADEKELYWQLRNFTDLLWVAGGRFGEANIHQIDEICWIKDSWPVSAHGVGGRAANNMDRGQNLDSFSVEWTFADGTKAYDVARYIPKCYEEFNTFIHGTKCAAQFSGDIHAGTCHIYKAQHCRPVKVSARYDGATMQYKYSDDQRAQRDDIVWRAPPEKITPWQAEWDVLLHAIRNDLPHNETKRAALSNLADIMGRAAVHTGRIITWNEAMASNFQFCPAIDKMNEDTPPPLLPDAQGRYPVPIPGQWSEI